MRCERIIVTTVVAPTNDTTAQLTLPCRASVTAPLQMRCFVEQSQSGRNRVHSIARHRHTTSDKKQEERVEEQAKNVVWKRQPTQTRPKTLSCFQRRHARQIDHDIILHLANCFTLSRSRFGNGLKP